MSNREEIAQAYATALKEKYPSHSGVPAEMHFAFADALLARKYFELTFLANGLNPVAKAVFSRFTGVGLPLTQARTLDALLEWSGVTPEEAELRKCESKSKLQEDLLKDKVGNYRMAIQWVRDRLDEGFCELSKQSDGWVLIDPSTGHGFKLSLHGSRMSLVRPFIKAEIALRAARKAYEACMSAQVEKKVA